MTIKSNQEFKYKKDMKHFNFNQSLRNLVNNCKSLFILSLALTTFGIGNVWGISKTKLTAYVEGGGKVCVNKSSSSAGTYSSSSSATNEHGVFDVNKEDTYYIWLSPNSGYSCTGYTIENNGDRVNSCTLSGNKYYIVKIKGYTSEKETKIKITFKATFYGKAEAYADPAAGGGTWISLNGNWPTSDANYIAEDNSTKNENTTAAPTFSAQYDAKAKDGYEFVGWYTANNGGGTKTSSTARYTENFTASSVDQNAPTTITRYAYFKALQYYYFKAQAGKVGTGNVYASFTDGSYSATSDIKTERATTLAQSQSTGTYTAYFKAEETDAAYHFAGWYTDAACTEANRVSTNPTYSEQISGSTATTEASAKTITRYAKFVQELTPEVTANYSGSPKAMFVDDEIASAFSFLNTSKIGSGLSVVSSNNNVITYDAANNKVIAKNEGTATLTFTQTKQDIIKAGEFSFTFNVSKIANTLTADATHSMKVDETWTGVISGKNSDATITTTTTDETVAYYDVTNNKIVAQNTGSQSFNSKEVTITISQAATYKYTAVEKTIKVTVNKWDNHISINGNQDSYATSIYMDAQQAINLTANNTDYAGSPITATQTAGNTIAALNAAQTQVTSNHNLGDATWTVSQPENYKYKAANASFTIHVVTQAEATDCYVKEDLNSDHEFSEEWSMTWEDENAAQTLTFRAKCQAAWTYGLYVCQYINGSWSEAKEGATNTTYISYDDLSTSYRPFEITLNKQTKGVKFVKRGTLKRTVRDIRVTRKTYLTADNVTVDKNENQNPVHPGEVGVNNLIINYSLANGGELKVTWDNTKFTIDGKTSAQGINLGDKGCSTGITNLAINYVSQKVGEDVANVVIYNNVYRATATIIGKTIKRDQNIQWNTDIMLVGQKEENAAQTTSIINRIITYTSDNPEVIRVNNDNNGQPTILEALQPGAANITAFSAGNEEYNDASDTKKITVTDKQIQYITWNQSLMGLKIGNADIPLNASAYQPDSLHCVTGGQRPIIYTSANTAVVEIVDGNKLRIKGIGVTTVTASQAGGTDGDGHDFIAVTAEKKVVVRDPNAPCETYIYEQTSEVKFDLGWNAASHQTKTHEIDFHGQEPGFVNFDYKGEAHKVLFDYYEGTLSIEQYVNNQWVEVRNFGKPSTSGYTNTGNIALSRNATKIRVKANDGMGYMYFKDCQITLARYLEGSSLSKFETKVGAPMTKTLTIKYSNISGPVTFSLSESSNFSLSKESIEGECGGHGSTTLDITYTPTHEAIGESATLTLADDIQKTQITLEGNASVTPLHINWDIPNENSCYTLDEITLSATALTDLNVEVPNFVWFSMAQNSTTGTISNNTLSFTKAGKANVVAQTIGDPRFTPAQNVFKSWTVNLTPTQITTKPSISTPIVSGSINLSDIVLDGGAAQNTINNQAVAGTFAVTAGDLVNVGEQTLTVTFTPNNTDMYESCTTTISVNVVQREATTEEVGTPSAASITYGNAINTSVLSGNGTLAGTWTWVDEDANKATPNVGTVDNLNVIFTPNDGNVKPVAATVSLTVTKADAQLTWTTAPTDVEISETVTYLATSNHSESAITYSITAGGEYATIDATTGALTMLKAGTITVQAAQAATDNYNAATITTTTTITGQLENKFTNADGDNDWENPNNWTNGVPTEENPDVIIAGEVIIDEPISVGGLTIEVNGKVTVINDGSLYVNGTSADRDTYGNLFIKNGGDITIATTGDVRVNDFVIESSIGTNGTSQSGQITNANRVIYANGAYIDINLDPTGKANDTQWYGFTVPFPVDVHDGVARKEGDTFRKLTYGTDYMFAEYDMNQRLSSGKGWKYITTSQLQPGRFYYITFNGDYNTYSFKAATNTITTSYTTDLTTNGTGANANANWNAVGNSALRHVTASYGTTDDETFVQVYQNGLSQYMTVRTNDATFVVGCPFFVQAKTSTILQLTDATNDPIDNTYAPLRKVTKANRSIKMVIAPENGGYSDQVYMRTTTDVKSEYIIGRDLAKAGVGTATVQMWINAYGQKLSVNETSIEGEEAIFPLGIYAPKAGGYRLTIDETDTPTYLMENGIVIWDFANGSYVVDLSKGTNNDYSIVRTAPNTPGEATDIYSTQQNNQSINKVIFRNKMYIINNAHTYDAQGQTIR